MVNIPKTDEFELSKSRVLMYINCTFQYKLKYICRLPEAKVPAYERGIAVHDILAKFWNKFFVKDIDKPILQFNDILRRLAGNKWEEYQIYLDNFLDFEVSRWKKLKTLSWRNQFFKPTHTELTLHQKGAMGIIDRIDYHPKKGYRIIDYKTGGTYGIEKNMFELAFYAHLVHHNFDFRVTRVAILNLKTGKLFGAPISMVDIAKAGRIAERVRTLISNEVFEKPKNPNCWFCPQNYKRICKKYNRKPGALRYTNFKNQEKGIETLGDL